MRRVLLLLRLRMQARMADIKLPPEVVEAAAMAVYEAWCKFHGVNATSMPWIDIDDEERQACFAEATVALIAGLEAWPGGWIDTLEEAAGVRRTIILPLPTSLQKVQTTQDCTNED